MLASHLSTASFNITGGKLDEYMIEDVSNNDQKNETTVLTVEAKRCQIVIIIQQS